MSRDRADELYEEGRTAFRKGDNERCIELTTASLDIGRELDDDAIIGQALLGPPSENKVLINNHDPTGDP